MDECYLYVPEASVELYMEADQWKNFLIFEPIEPTGINTPNVDCDDVNDHYYDLNGQQLQQPRKGVNIVKSSDGKTRKIVVK